jgi:hypothetical protein
MTSKETNLRVEWEEKLSDYTVFELRQRYGIQELNYPITGLDRPRGFQNAMAARISRHWVHEGG